MTGRPHADLPVSELLALWPRASRSFVRHGMACVGCTMSSFETVREAAANYGIDLEPFLAALRRDAGGRRKAPGAEEPQGG